MSPPVVLNHLLEAALFVMAIALVRRAWARALLAALYFVIVGAQLLTYDLSYAFLTQLALDNIDSSFLVWTDRKALFALSLGLLALAIAAAAVFGKPRDTRLPAWSVAAGGVGALVYLYVNLWPASLFGPRFEQHAFVEERPAVASFVRMVIASVSDRPIAEDLSDRDALPAFMPAVDWSRKFPLVRDTIYRTPPPLGELPGDHRRPDVLLLFVEGLSAATLNYSSGLFADLAPGISAFARASGSIAVRHYYNHTVATYRGLFGQLCSIYPGRVNSGWFWRSAENLNLNCLPHLFAQAGYETVFLYSNFGEGDYAAELLKKTGFETVLQADDLTERYLDRQPGFAHQALTNREFFEALSRFYETRDRSAGPLLVALYTQETHAFVDTRPDDVKYRDGTNHAFNTIRALDAHFSGFLDRFNKLPASRNTVVILTTDHARFPEPAYVEAMRAALPARRDWEFVDEIPLILHVPGATPARELDARYANSLDLAPTIAHLVGLPNGRTHFLGTSLFERRHDRSATSWDDQFFELGSGGIRRIGISDAPENVAIRSEIRRIEALVGQNRVWPGRRD